MRIKPLNVNALNEPRILTPALSRPTGEGAPATAGAGEGQCARFMVPMRVQSWRSKLPMYRAIESGTEARALSRSAGLRALDCGWQGREVPPPRIRVNLTGDPEWFLEPAPSCAFKSLSRCSLWRSPMLRSAPGSRSPALRESAVSSACSLHASECNRASRAGRHDVPPHPCPLPEGEGDPSAALARFVHPWYSVTLFTFGSRRRHGVEGCSDGPRADEAFPSPRGRGLGRGGKRPPMVRGHSLRQNACKVKGLPPLWVHGPLGSSKWNRWLPMNRDKENAL